MTAASSADEGEQVTFTVTVSGITQTAQVRWSTGYGTAGANDFTAVTNSRLSFSASRLTRTFFVRPHTDSVVEGDETFTVTVVGSGELDGLSASGTGTIRDVPPPEETP